MSKDLRETRAGIFKDTMHLCETNKKLADSIIYSKKYQEVITENMDIPVPLHQNGMPAKVLVSRNRSLEAARKYHGRKVCVLNFASATIPGGGVVKGSNAQEEAICRCSSLYACISSADTEGSFYSSHRHKLRGGQMSSLYNDDCIYTPDVMVFKTDTAKPELMPEPLWYKADVITCAAPDLRAGHGSAAFHSAGRVYSIGIDTLFGLHKKRAGRILDIAKMNGAEAVVLGAFGCGAFQNPPEISAWAMLEAVRIHLHDFIVVEFAVYCTYYDTKNFDVFRRIWAPVCG